VPVQAAPAADASAARDAPRSDSRAWTPAAAALVLVILFLALMRSRATRTRPALLTEEQRRATLQRIESWMLESSAGNPVSGERAGASE
jgi:hypothetical protein